MASTVIGPKPLHEESKEFIQSKLIEHVPRFAQGTDQQAGNLVGALEAIIEHQLWRYAGCDSLADYANKYLGHSDTWCREVVRIFMEDWNAEQRSVGTTQDISRAATLAVSENPASEAQKGNRNAVRDKGNQGAEMHNGLSPQAERASGNGISIRHQKTLDKIAKLAPDYLPRIAAKEISINRSAVELGIVKVKTPLDRALSAFQRLSPDDRVTFMELVGSMMDQGCPPHVGASAPS